MASSYTALDSVALVLVSYLLLEWPVVLMIASMSVTMTTYQE